jgi:predicted GIY-YIG superfamily endonuclease
MIVYVWKRKDGAPFYVGMTKNYGRADPTKAGGRGWLCKQTLVDIGPKNVVVEVHHVDTTKEASALEQKLEKYKKIKLGMMQELLTGKTRLI